MNENDDYCVHQRYAPGSDYFCELPAHPGTSASPCKAGKPCFETTPAPSNPCEGTAAEMIYHQQSAAPAPNAPDETNSTPQIPSSCRVTSTGDGKAEGAPRTDAVEREFARGRTAQVFVRYVHELERIVDHELPAKDAEIERLTYEVEQHNAEVARLQSVIAERFAMTRRQSAEIDRLTAELETKKEIQFYEKAGDAWNELRAENDRLNVELAGERERHWKLAEEHDKLLKAHPELAYVANHLLQQRNPHAEKFLKRYRAAGYKNMRNMGDGCACCTNYITALELSRESRNRDEDDNEKTVTVPETCEKCGNAVFALYNVGKWYCKACVQGLLSLVDELENLESMKHAEIIRLARENENLNRLYKGANVKLAKKIAKLEVENAHLKKEIETNKTRGYKHE